MTESEAPKFRGYQYCPICATPLTVKSLFGRERQQCPECDWIHFIDPKVGAGVLIEKKGQVLLARRGMAPSRGDWHFPSGFVDAEESPEEAAIRECKEETGLDVHLVELIDVFHYTADFRGEGVFILYRGEITGGTPKAMDDVTELAFFAPDDLPQNIAFRSNQMALQRWLREKLSKQLPGQANQAG